VKFTPQNKCLRMKEDGLSLLTLCPAPVMQTEKLEMSRIAIYFRVIKFTEHSVISANGKWNCHVRISLLFSFNKRKKFLFHVSSLCTEQEGNVEVYTCS
jgi:hypothetical protein